MILSEQDSIALAGLGNHPQWGKYVFDLLVNYENWPLLENGTTYDFTHLSKVIRNKAVKKKILQQRKNQI